MREQFSEYYTPTDSEYLEYLTSGHIVLDTNVLLSPYRVDAQTRNQLFQLLEGLKERLWIPHHIGWEFFQNRPTVVAGEDKIYRDLEKPIKDALEKVGAHLATLSNHPVVSESDGVALLRHLEDALSLASRMSAGRNETLENVLRADETLAKWEELLRGRIGSAPSRVEVEEYEALAKKRYEDGIPPGNLDEKKSSNKYGDAIIWLQILDFVKSDPAPVLLITNDVKEDWYLRQSGQTIGPRVELVREMRTGAGSKYYQQRLPAFLRRASAALKSPITTEAIEQVSRAEESSHADEMSRSVIETLARLPLVTGVISGHRLDVEVDILALTMEGTIGVMLKNTARPVSSAIVNKLAVLSGRAKLAGLVIVSAAGFTRVAQHEIAALAIDRAPIMAIEWNPTMPDEFLGSTFMDYLRIVRSKKFNSLK